MSLDIEPPTYVPDIDEDNDKCFIFGIYYESDLNMDPVTLETVLSSYGCACEQHFNADMFKDFNGSLRAIYEDSEEEQCDGSYVILINKN